MAAPRARTTDEHGLSLLQLPAELLGLILCRLDTRGLCHIASCCRWLYHGPSGTSEPESQTSPVEDALRQRARRRAVVVPVDLPAHMSSLGWLQYLLRREWQSAVPRSRISTSDDHCLLLDAADRLLSCGTEDLFHGHGVLGHGKHGQLLLSTPTPIPSMADVRVRSVAAFNGNSFALGRQGELYSWGKGFHGVLGHGDEESRHEPAVVDALRGQRVISVTSNMVNRFVCGKCRIGFKGLLF